MLKATPKHITTVVLLIVFCISEFQYLFPYLEYSVNYEYITKELCENREDKTSTCHGKCHLNKQIKKAAKESENKKKNGVRNDKEKRLFITYNLDTKHPNQFSYLRKERFGEAPFWIKDIFISPPTPPPQC